MSSHYVDRGKISTKENACRRDFQSRISKREYASFQLTDTWTSIYFDLLQHIKYVNNIGKRNEEEIDCD